MACYSLPKHSARSWTSGDSVTEFSVSMARDSPGALEKLLDGENFHKWELYCTRDKKHNLIRRNLNKCSYFSHLQFSPKVTWHLLKVWVKRQPWSHSSRFANCWERGWFIYNSPKWYRLRFVNIFKSQEENMCQTGSQI